jgi:hypothetical protein
VLFKGRRDLRDAVVHALLEGTRPTLVLKGPRRMGKTSFLQQLPALLPGKTIPVFIDMQKPSLRTSDSAFLFGLSRAIVESVKPYQISLPGIERSDDRSLTFEGFDRWLDEVVPKHLQDYNLLISFDEFEKLGQALSEKALSLQVLDELRYTIQNRSKIALLFAGVHTLEDLGPEWSSYFINVRTLSIGYLSPSEAEDLIRNPNPEVEFKLKYTDDAVRQILDDTLGHPYLVQLVCSCVVELANARGVLRADRKLVKAGEKLSLERGETYFRNVWDEMAGPAGRPLLRQVAAASQPVLLSIEDPEARRALDQMVKWKVLAKINGPTDGRSTSFLGRLFGQKTDPGDRYTIEVPIIRYWVVQNAPE